MKTPAGKECRYFYGDYFRGRIHEECRLLSMASSTLPWKPSFCGSCPVPQILMANACENLILKPYLNRPFPFLSQKVGVHTQCKKSQLQDFDPFIGCGHCHPLPSIFTKDSYDTDATT